MTYKFGFNIMVFQVFIQVTINYHKLYYIVNDSKIIGGRKYDEL